MIISGTAVPANLAEPIAPPAPSSKRRLLTTDNIVQRIETRLAAQEVPPQPAQLTRAVRTAQEHIAQQAPHGNDEQLAAAGLIAHADLTVKQRVAQSRGSQAWKDSMHLDMARGLVREAIGGIAAMDDLAQQSKSSILQEVADSKFVRTLGEGTHTLGQMVLGIEQQAQLSDSEKSQLIDGIAHSRHARDLGPGTVKFLEQIPQVLQASKSDPTDLSKAAKANHLAHHLLYGEKIEGLEGAALRNAIGQRLGFKADRAPDSASEAQQLLDGRFDVYRGEQAQKVQAIAQAYGQAGEGASLASRSASIDPRDGEAGVFNTVLWRIDPPQGKARWLHQSGEKVALRTRTYKNLEDFVQTQPLFREGRLIVGNADALNNDGQLSYKELERTESWSDKLGRYANYALTGVTVAAGVALLFTGAGTAPGGALLALAVTGGVAMSLQAGDEFEDRTRHGESNALGQQTYMSYATQAMALAAPLSSAAQSAAVGLSARGMHGLAQGATGVEASAHAANAGGFAATLYDTADHWSERGGVENAMALANTGLFVGGVAVGVHRTHKLPRNDAVHALDATTTSPRPPKHDAEALLKLTTAKKKGHAWIHSRQRYLTDLGRMVAFSPLTGTAITAANLAMATEGQVGNIRLVQLRLGHGLEEIKIHKIRTMGGDTLRPDYVPGPSTGAKDARATPRGEIVRAFIIDELVSQADVARGDLALFGYRPLVKADVAEMKASLAPKEYAAWIHAYKQGKPGILSVFGNASPFLSHLPRKEFLRMRALMDSWQYEHANPKLERALTKETVQIGLKKVNRFEDTIAYQVMLDMAA